MRLPRRCGREGQRMKFHVFYMMAGQYTREVEVRNS